MIMNDVYAIQYLMKVSNVQDVCFNVVQTPKCFNNYHIPDNNDCPFYKSYHIHIYD